MQNKINKILISIIMSAVFIFNSGISITAYEKDTYQSKWEIGEKVPLPDMPTNVKYYTDYRCYNIEGTPHNRLQKVCVTDMIGCRRFNNDYCVAAASYYTTKIGDRFEINLESGNAFTIIVADQKADCDTDITNMYSHCINYDGENCANVIEFIIDKDVVSDKMYAYGSLDYYGFFKGNIESMIYLGRDNSGDWDTYK